MTSCILPLRVEFRLLPVTAGGPLLMEYKSRYKQPFRLEEAITFDIPTITAEIQRLQNSLQYLRSTQKQLNKEIQREFCSILSEAYEENEQVIGSQEERISILRLALDHKGAVAQSNTHYLLPTTTEQTSAPDTIQAVNAIADTQSPQPEVNHVGQTLNRTRDTNDYVPDDSEGVYL